MKPNTYLLMAVALLLSVGAIGCAAQKTYIGAGSGFVGSTLNAPQDQSMIDGFVKSCMDQKAAAEAKGLTCHPRPRDGYVVTQPCQLIVDNYPNSNQWFADSEAVCW
jgi:hypothetical protein